MKLPLHIKYLFFLVLLITFNTCTSGKKTTVATKKEQVLDTLIAISKNTEYSKDPIRYLKDSVSEISINLVGDLMCHLPQTTNAKLTDGSYDFNPSFEYVRPYLSDADITIGNLETTFAGTTQPYAGYPAFNSPDAYCTALKNAGFDFLVTANNHSMDTKEAGLLRTIDVIKQHGLGYAGTYLNQKDRDSIRIITIKGIKIAILNYTYGTNGAYPASQHNYMLNVIDSAIITNDIVLAKRKGSDAILVFYHMGLENIAEPTKAQDDAVKFALNAGANLVIGAHPHVLGPTKEVFSKTISDTAFVAYSLGNFLSNQYWRYTDAGVILKLHIQKNFTQNKTRYTKATYLPTWVYRGDGNKKMHIVFPAQLCNDNPQPPNYLNNTHINKMKEAFEDSKLIITKYNNRIELEKLKK